MGEDIKAEIDKLKIEIEQIKQFDIPKIQKIEEAVKILVQSKQLKMKEEENLNQALSIAITLTD